jgi:hypothetical protein
MGGRGPENGARAAVLVHLASLRDPNQDYSGEPPTLVEFTLRSIPTGTSLRVVESGFDKLPSNRRLEAFRMNDGGWGQQIQNIREHVERTF